MTDPAQAGAQAPAAGPQCPEALYNPDTGALRRCVLGPHAGGDLHAWHQTESGTQWRHRIDESMEGPEWTPPF